MKAFIFMNEKVHQQNPTGPVIRVQAGKRIREGNEVHIHGPSVVRFDPAGLKVCKTHHVKAWIEAEDVQVLVK